MPKSFRMAYALGNRLILRSIQVHYDGKILSSKFMHHMTGNAYKKSVHMGTFVTGNV